MEPRFSKLKLLSAPPVIALLKSTPEFAGLVKLIVFAKIGKVASNIILLFALSIIRFNVLILLPTAPKDLPPAASPLTLIVFPSAGASAATPLCLIVNVPVAFTACVMLSAKIIFLSAAGCTPSKSVLTLKIISPKLFQFAPPLTAKSRFTRNSSLLFSFTFKCLIVSVAAPVNISEEFIASVPTSSCALLPIF